MNVHHRGKTNKKIVRERHTVSSRRRTLWKVVKTSIHVDRMCIVSSVCVSTNDYWCLCCVHLHSTSECTSAYFIFLSVYSDRHRQTASQTTRQLRQNKWLMQLRVRCTLYTDLFTSTYSASDQRTGSGDVRKRKIIIISTYVPIDLIVRFVCRTDYGWIFSVFVKPQRAWAHTKTNRCDNTKILSASASTSSWMQSVRIE